METNGRDFRVPVAVTLRECSVVIVGSRCRICGRDFKCESDVALHTRWRHNEAIGSLMAILDHEMNLTDQNLVGQKCDVCGMSFRFVTDLRIHKRLIHKQRLRSRGRRQREMVRVRFKLNGVTTTDVSLERRYIKLENSFEYFVDVCAQTSDPLKSERRQNDCVENIDLCLPNHVADKSHMQHDIRPHKAANQYNVGKFASTKGDAVARHTVVVGKSLVEISNTPHKDAIPDGSYDGYKDRCYLAFQKTAADVFVKSTSADSMDVCDKENTMRKVRTNEQERRNISVCQSEILLGDDSTKDYLACQPETSHKTLPVPEQNSWSCEIWPDKVAEIKETTGLASSVDSLKIIVNNERSYDLDRNATTCFSPALSRFDRKIESIRTNFTNSNVDDDVQEVLRIMRGNTQNDINHESPNRMEREMLVQNIISNTLPSQQKPSVHPGMCGVAFEPPNHSSFLNMTENNYRLLANSFDKKLDIYLEDYGIRLYNELPEINNNLEEYSVYTRQDIYDSDEPPYISELVKANDNEEAVVLD